MLQKLACSIRCTCIINFGQLTKIAILIHSGQEACSRLSVYVALLAQSRRQRNSIDDMHNSCLLPCLYCRSHRVSCDATWREIWECQSVEDSPCIECGLGSNVVTASQTQFSRICPHNEPRYSLNASCI